MNDRRVAILCLAVLAFLIAGLMVETYWDCRLLKGGTMQSCLPPIGARPAIP
jgi:hypothetical protein